MLEIAKSKTYSNANVKFKTSDIFQLSNSIKHESLFAGFIWSHIKLQKLNTFIDAVNTLVQPGATIVFIDNNYVEGSSTALSGTDDCGNTYQTRKLEDGTMHKVVKNFPDELFLKQVLKNKAAGIEIITLTYFWILKYKTPKRN